MVILTGHHRARGTVTVDMTASKTVTLPNDITLPGTTFSVFLIAVRYANLLRSDDDGDDTDEGFIIDDDGFVVGAASISMTLTNQPANGGTSESLPIMAMDPSPAMTGGDNLAVPPSGGFPDDPIAVLA